jgi:hypothetical protein
MWRAEFCVAELGGIYRGGSSAEFFTLKDFAQWKRKVLELLSQPTSDIHDIVRRGNLPIWSKNSGNWFGVTASCRYYGQRVCHSKDLDHDDPKLWSRSLPATPRSARVRQAHATLRAASSSGPQQRNLLTHVPSQAGARRPRQNGVVFRLVFEQCVSKDV